MTFLVKSHGQHSSTDLCLTLSQTQAYTVTPQSG